MRDPIEQLRRIQNALGKIAGYVNKGRRKFNEEEEIQLSIIYYLQTISEAARAIPQQYRIHHPEIPWKQLLDFQNFITYYYREIDLDATWHSVNNDLPTLKPKIDALIRKEEQQIIIPSQENNETSEALKKLLQAKREDILRTAMTYGISNVRVFGSVVRGEADEASDIDLLVDVEPGRTLFDLDELLADLQNLLGHEVDIVTEKGLNRRVRERVLKEAVPLAANAIPPDFRNSHLEIPWRTMINMRNKLIHNYDGIDLDIVWETATTNIPALASKIQVIIMEES